MSQCLNYLRRKNHRLIRKITRSRRQRLKISLMRNQGLSPALAKEIASGYVYERSGR